MDNIYIRQMVINDWNRVSEIYKQGLDLGIATFQTVLPTFEEWDKFHKSECRLVAVIDDEIIGWTALSQVSGRIVYKGIAELSIYVDQQWKNKGVGRKLLTALMHESEKHGYWTLQANILEENIASIELHKKCGFRVVGYREKLGKDKFGIWRNTVLLEYRSKVIG